jgi:deazaflavin-dependent oxidoreductase (nitroreductase family)
MTLDGEQMHAQNSQVIDEFRRNRGHVDGSFEGAPVLLLHTVGAKGGAERINPMMYQQVGDAYAVFASAAGDDDHPAWYHNLLAHPDVTAEVGCTALAHHARVLDDAERAPIWERQKSTIRVRRLRSQDRPHHPGRPTRTIETPRGCATATNSGAGLPTPRSAGRQRSPDQLDGR